MEIRAPFRFLAGKRPDEVFEGLNTPCYVIEEQALMRNGELLRQVSGHTGAKILLAQKAFSGFDFYPMLAEYLAGTEASGLYEARLGAEKMPQKEVHVFCAAYRQDEFEELMQAADHIVFNSVYQLRTFGPQAAARGKSIGLRINPMCSTQEGHAIYDPCAPGSRLGVTRSVWDREMTPELLELLDGIHFHTLCEQNADALEVTWNVVQQQFGDILSRMKWINFGGGHHITRDDYDVELLESIISQAKTKWNADIYLEPGEAVALNAGYLITRVLDIVENQGIRTAVVDTSAACHMPDVIEMPYTPPLYGTLENGGHRYRLGGPTCLAGDIIGEYRFEKELERGDLLVFGDMAIYSMVKNNTFNGMALPAIAARAKDGTLRMVAEFGYDDFAMRLGSR